ncbi:salivary glue protein Sgs-5 [Drosophila ananassae]|uniref:salivary glue protein Sgs-5 n=1 Tax=Drosophila ananassae TaxID=7217 RepID=UPI0013A5D1C7|nr:salivary glue protein Sgs-5 [Drosophila ananassae]
MFILNFIPVAVAVLVVAQATIIIKPNPCPPNPNPPCNDWDKNYTWTLENCVCRVFQNPCLRKLRNTNRLQQGKTPLLIVDQDVCAKFIKKCCDVCGPQVKAKFPVPSPCGCNGKTGTYRYKTFANLCELNRYSALNSDPYISWTEK